MLITETEWLVCAGAASLFEELRFGPSKRKLRLFAAACLRRVWPLLGHEATRLAVEACEQYADGLIRHDELLELWTNAELDADERLWLGPDSRWDCDCRYCTGGMGDGREEAEQMLRRVRAGEASPAWTAAQAVFHARDLVAWQAEPAQRAAAAEQERQAQYVLLMDLFGGSPTPGRINPVWLIWNDRTIPRLARSMYRSGAFDQMPILADALEDAGCPDAGILSHCRGPGPHVRGCWVVDLLLGKT